MPIMSVKYCGFVKYPQHPHTLQHGVHVNQKFVSFILKSHKNFDPATEVCRRCNNAMESMYFKKKEKARQLRASRNGIVSSVSSLSQTQSVSSIPSFDHSTSDSSLSQSVSMMDSFDRLVTKTPMHRKQDKTKSVNGDFSTKSVAHDLAIENMGGSEISSSQSLNEPSVGNNKQTAEAVLQESRREMSTTSAPITEQRLGEIQIQDRRTVKSLNPRNVLALTRNNDVVPSPTIYDYEENGHHNIVQDISVRLSQEPTTSAAAQVPTAGNGKISKMRCINDFFGSVPKNVIRAANTNKTNSSTANNLTGTPRTSNKRHRHIVAEDSSQNESDIADNGRQESSYDNDDDEPTMSLNYYNDSVRLPQYQPIPKRRPFIHTDPRIMDMYIKGMNGG